MKTYGFLNNDNVIEKITLSDKNYNAENIIILPYFSNDFLGAKYENGEIIKVVEQVES